LTVGPMVQTNLTPFTGLNLTPGVKYNLLLKIVPKDGYLTYRGLPAVRINGNIWARHNMGVNISVDPDALPMTSSRHGNYYQWGKILSTGTGTSTTQNGNYNNTIPNGNAWNSGTENSPSKNTANDPCPTGWRVPTKTEMQILLNATTTRSVGSRTERMTNYSGATILTSKRKRDVIMTIPAQGGMSVDDGPIPGGVHERGLNFYLWCNTPSIIDGVMWGTTLYGNPDGSIFLYEGSHRLRSHNIRCIGI
ncbi:hypothetical protein, partial [Sphingobacterium kitahiroshimense]|uniref:hypothetical protein n=1 Tax=Sphingobacterium kitahiroshimense TaxID=470446 RepID=UPI0032098FAA